MTKLLHGELTYYLRGICFKIRNELGGSHAEEVYEDALAWQLAVDKMPFRRQPVYRIVYKGKQVGEYRPDMTLAESNLILELNVAPNIEAIHKAQAISYLAVTVAELALLINFGASSMQFERLPNFLHNRKPITHDHSPLTDALSPEISAMLMDGLFEVHRTLSPGFLHQAYRRATLHELPQHGLTVQYIKELPIRYQGNTLCMTETRLLMVEQKILLAVVAMTHVTNHHSERLRWAMRELGCRLGIVANFYPSKLDIRFYR